MQCIKDNKASIYLYFLIHIFEEEKENFCTYDIYISTELSLPPKESQSTGIDVDATANSMPGTLFICY